MTMGHWHFLVLTVVMAFMGRYNKINKNVLLEQVRNSMIMFCLLCVNIRAESMPFPTYCHRKKRYKENKR